MEADKLFYIGQKAFIEKNGKVLVVIHSEKGLDFPGGKIQIADKTIDESLKREVAEETGLQIEIGHPFTVWIHPDRNIYLIGFACKYLSGEISLNHEHISYQWVDKNSYKHIKDTSGYHNALEKYFNIQK